MPVNDYTQEVRQHILDTLRYSANAIELETLRSAAQQELYYSTIPVDLIVTEEDIQESASMATGTSNLLNSTTPAPTIRFYEAPARPAKNTVFQMKQNTHEIELRALREKYNSAVFTYDFTQPLRFAFSESRNLFHSNYKAVKRLIAAREAITTAKRKNVPHLRVIIDANFSYSDLAYIHFPGVAPNIESTRTYCNAVNVIAELRSDKTAYLDSKRRFGALQAEHNQRAAMIRQKPERYIAIDIKQVADTIATWDHVWGVDHYISNADKAVYLRVGLCNIRMEESASTSYYANPESILLAPFYITIKLTSTGRATCPSRDNCTYGLSRTNNPGHGAYDIHPHQLSDQPCFGTFGQTLVDMSNNGDLISYVGTLIAFYSQYNSQDSAGVAAQYYHPSCIHLFEHPQNYTQNLLIGLNAYKQEPIINVEKLKTAIDEYAIYHQQCNINGERIELQHNQVCHSCDDADVSDDSEYYNDHNMNRICPGCWSDHYCGDCERHMEDCRCDPDDED